MGFQVEELTQGLQPWEKEFIDFSFDGKHISEFGLVAVSDSDRHSTDASPSFSDETSKVNGLSGQYFWGTTFDAGKKNFKLATDGMTEKQLSAFKKHFIPGRYGKLILDERIGRYCYARVSSVVTLSFVPFQEDVTIQGISFQTNIYKGEASISFEMDYPLWRAESNYIDMAAALTQESVRKAYVNNIPLSSSFYNETNISSKPTTGQPDTADSKIMLDSPLYRDILAALNNKPTDAFITSGDALYVGDATYYLTKDGIAAQNTYDATTDSDKHKMVLYNASECSSPIDMTLKEQSITITPTAPYYINFARDSINAAGTDRQYSMFFIRNYDEKITNVMKYTNPALFYFINYTISLAYSYKDTIGANLVDFQSLLQEEIHHQTVLSWAAAGLRFISTHAELYNQETGVFETSSITIYDYKGDAQTVKWYEYLNYWMLNFCAPASESEEGDPLLIDIAEQNGTCWTRNGSLGTFTIEINGEDNASFITYGRHSIGTVLINLENLCENCGEMMLSEYLKVEGGSCLDDNLDIQPKTCYLLYNIKDNVLVELDKKNIVLEYRYLYL
nr:MAG TPA: tail protein [Caudoviricetes sp.]